MLFRVAAILTISWVVVVAHADRLVLGGVNVVTMNDAEDVLKDQTIVIEAGRIQAIMPRERYAFVPGDEWIRWEDTWVMPAFVAIDVGSMRPFDPAALASSGFTVAHVASHDASVLATLAIDRWQTEYRPTFTICDLPAEVMASRLGLEWIGRNGENIPYSSASGLLASVLAGVEWRRAELRGFLAGSGRLVPSVYGAGTRLLSEALQNEIIRIAAISDAATALRCATRLAADAIGEGDDLGRVEVGRRAELLIFESDPRDDVRTIRKPKGVVLNGSLLYPAQTDVILHQAHEGRDAEIAARGAILASRVLPNPTTRATWIIRIDGFVSGTQHVELMETDEAVIIASQIDRLGPAAATIRIDAHAAVNGVIHEAKVRFESKFQRFTLEAARRDRSLAVHFEVEGQPPEPDSTIELPSDADLSIDDLLLAWRIARADAPLHGEELVFGEGPVALEHFALEPAKVMPAHDLRSTHALSLGLDPISSEAIRVEFDRHRLPTRVSIDSPFGLIQYERLSP